MEATAELAPTTHSLLRPDQIEEMEAEQQALDRKMHNPAVQDKGAVMEQMKRLSRQLETQRPQPYSSSEIDAAVKRESELKDEIRDGMLSQEEMRKCPPGAVDRHRAWEAKNKKRILEWQNIQRRLNAGNENREMASIEMFRPTTSHMNMDGALIPGKGYFLPPPGVGPTVTFSDEEMALIMKHAPEDVVRLSLLSNAQRAEIKRAIATFRE